MLYKFWLCFFFFRFKHKSPEDPNEVPGGFVTDCNLVSWNEENLCWYCFIVTTHLSLDIDIESYNHNSRTMSETKMREYLYVSLDMAIQQKENLLKLIYCLQDSLTTIDNAMVDVSVKNAKLYDRFQFERNGFFSIDDDSTPDKVMNLMITLSSRQVWLSQEFAGKDSSLGMDVTFKRWHACCLKILRRERAMLEWVGNGNYGQFVASLRLLQILLAILQKYCGLWYHWMLMISRIPKIYI